MSIELYEAWKGVKPGTSKERAVLATKEIYTQRQRKEKQEIKNKEAIHTNNKPL